MSDYDSPTGDTPMTQYAGEKGEATPYDEGFREGRRRVAGEVDRLIARVEEMKGTKTSDGTLKRLLMENIAENTEIRRRLAEIHQPYADSRHCEADGEPWPCATMIAAGVKS